MKKLSEFPNIPRSGNSSYNYDVLFNGDVWALKKGEDFQGKVNNVMMTLRKQAKSRGLQVLIAKKDDDTIVVKKVSGGEE